MIRAGGSAFQFHVSSVWCLMSEGLTFITPSRLALCLACIIFRYFSLFLNYFWIIFELYFIVFHCFSLFFILFHSFSLFFFVSSSLHSVIWYTSMLGKKVSLKTILKMLKSENIKNVRTTRLDEVNLLFFPPIFSLSWGVFSFLLFICLWVTPSCCLSYPNISVQSFGRQYESPCLCRGFYSFSP